jgi:hypothetical protein
VALAWLHESSKGPTTLTADITSSQADNILDGNNRETLTQNAAASSGDGIAGQVTGVVTSAGGTTSAVVANASTSIDVLSGDSTFTNHDVGFVGLATISGGLTLL